MTPKQNNPPIKQDDKVEKQIEKLSKQINYGINEYTIGFIADEMQKEDKSNFYIPKYQREFVWKESRRSRFIESIIMGLPIPFIFYYENTKTGKLEIVDGSQRIRSIHAFIYDGFRLSNLERLTELSGKTFNDLTESRQRKIRNKSIRGIVLSEHADVEARQDLFNRINTGSLKAEPAEIRRGSLQGKFMKLVTKLADLSYFTEITPISSKRKNTREREELVTRFFAYGDGLEDYKDVVETFLFDYVKKMNKKMKANKSLIEEYENRFEQTMKYIKKIFPFGGFRKTGNATRVTRVRFESIAVGTWLAMQDVQDEKNILADRIGNWINQKEYTDLLRSDGGNVITKLRARIEYVQKHLTEKSE
jgi:hypothetical protein